MPPVYGIHLNYDGFRRCGQYEGIPPARPSTMRCDIQAIGRYVYVYVDREAQLRICEFEVYGTREYTLPPWYHFIYILAILQLASGRTDIKGSFIAYSKIRFRYVDE